MDKYYADCLRSVPGRLPLFRDGVAQSALTEATSERGVSVLLEIDLGSISGEVQVITAADEVHTHHFPEQLPDDVTCILIPAPLPTKRIQRVLFSSNADRNQYQLRQEELPTIANLQLPVEVAKFPVAQTFMNQHWLPACALPALQELPVNAVLREAAVLAALHHLGNRGELSMKVATAAFSDTPSVILENAAFREVMNQALAHGVLKREAAELRIRLYWGVVDRLRELSNKNVGVEQAVLDYLDHTAVNDSFTGSKLNELAADLRQSLGIGNSTIRELFERHAGPFAHALLLLFLRKHTDELFNFDTPGVVMSEADLLAAAILFALREDWRATPVALRNASGLYSAIAQRMAVSIHRSIGSGIDLGGTAPHPNLREMFSLVGGRWTSCQHAGAIELVRAMKWTEAIETRVQLGKGNYRLEVGTGGVQIVLPGEIKAVITEVRVDTLLDYLSQCRWPIDPQIEARVRAITHVK